MSQVISGPVTIVRDRAVQLVFMDSRANLAQNTVSHWIEATDAEVGPLEMAGARVAFPHTWMTEPQEGVGNILIDRSMQVFLCSRRFLQWMTDEPERKSRSDALIIQAGDLTGLLGEDPGVEEAQRRLNALVDQALQLGLRATLETEGIALATGLTREVARAALAHFEDRAGQAIKSGTLLQLTPPRQLPTAPVKLDTAPIGLPVRMLRVMIGGPNDTKEEREAAMQMVAEWNLRHAEAEEIVLLPKHWTTHTRPALRGRAQAVVNEQLTDRADVLVALFWSRLGTDTGVAESGTVEEIDQFYASGRSVLLYFAEKPLPFQKAGNADAQAELRRVQEFRARVERDHLGLYDTYSTTEQFQELFARHLFEEVRDLKRRQATAQGMNGGTQSARTMLQHELTVLRGAIGTQNSIWQARLSQQPKRPKDAVDVLRRINTVLAEHFGRMSDALDAADRRRLQSFVTATLELERRLNTRDAGASLWRDGTLLLERLQAFLRDLETDLQIPS